MITIICDACKKAIPNARSGVNTVYIGDKTMCKKCEAELEGRTRDALAREREYTLMSFKNHYTSLLRKMCS